jgi:hypothetical protein
MAIVAGNQPPELSAKALTERIELPLLWRTQEVMPDSTYDQYGGRSLRGTAR